MFERLLTSFQNIFKIPELRTRVLFTLGMLVVYRIGAHIPTPGINGEALQEFLQKQGGALLGFLDIFSGGSLSRLTIFALGIFGLGSQAKKKAAAFIVMSITGGALMPKLMGRLGDLYDMSASFWMPLGCFILIMGYGFFWSKLSQSDGVVGMKGAGGH